MNRFDVHNCSIHTKFAQLISFHETNDNRLSEASKCTDVEAQHTQTLGDAGESCCKRSQAFTIAEQQKIRPSVCACVGSVHFVERRATATEWPGQEKFEVLSEQSYFDILQRRIDICRQ